MWGPRGRGRAQEGRARPPPSWLTGASPWCVLSARNSQIFYRKSYSILRAFGELYFRGIFYCMDNSENRQKNTIFALFILNNRK